MAFLMLGWSFVLVSCTLAINGHFTSWEEGKVESKDRLIGTSITRRILKSPGLGGDQGASFDDRLSPLLKDFVNINRVQTISISFGDYLESLQVTYLLSNNSFFTPPRRGVVRSSEVVITLAYNEYLVKVEGYHNSTMVQQITFTTLIYGYDNKSTHVYGPYGSTGNTSFSVEGFVVGFYGHFDDKLNNLGIYALASLNKSEGFGGGNDSKLTYFDDKPDEYYAPISRMNSIRINHGDAVDAFKTVYTVLNGDILQTDTHGGSGGIQTTIYLTEDEAIIGVEGSTDGQYINQIKFITERQRDGTVRGYGPFGKAASKQFSFYGNILGFSGSYINYIHSISVYFT